MEALRNLRKGVFDLARHKCVGMLLEDAQTRRRAEIDSLAAIDNTWISLRVRKRATASSVAMICDVHF